MSGARRQIQVITGTAGSPARDTAVTRALLAEVAAGDAPETLRLFRLARNVAFGPQDRSEPGFATAVASARAQGFDAIVRLAGGRAAVYLEHTLAFAWAVPAADPRDGVHARFEEIAAITVDTLAAFGVDARVGAVPGEYCPGDHSVNADGRVKLMGVGQRLVRGAAHVGGVIVVRDAAVIRRVLDPVYGALGLDWDPATVGSIEDVTGVAVSDADADTAFLDAFARRHDLVDAALAQRWVDAAVDAEADYVP